ncbi:uncharacterized protein LOC141594639 [Silene latifolia]|uniref:uncharacterized protein LOC141594639 n=1 Tax=Silene latifolia TaxID=37657 RepID=UPI003D78457A
MRINQSWGYRSIVYGLELVRENFAWKPGVSSNLNVWTSNWVSGSKPNAHVLLVDLVSNWVTNLRVKDLINVTGRWDVFLVKDIFTEACASKILALPICASRSEDEVYWKFTTTGEYTAKSGYGIFENFFKAKVLSVGSEFVRRNIDIDPICHFCWVDLGMAETTAHPFRHRHLVMRLWASSPLRINCSSNVLV